MSVLRLPLVPAPAPPRAPAIAPWAAAVDRAAQPCLLTSTDGTVTAHSAAARRLFGSSLEVGRPIGEVWRHAGDEQGSVDVVPAVVARLGGAAHVMVRLLLRGAETAVVVVSVALSDTTADVAAVLTLLWPVTG